MPNKTIVATYPNLYRAIQVFHALMANIFERQDIGVAIHETTGEALLTVFADELTAGTAIYIVNHYKPNQLTECEMGWRQSDDFIKLYPGEDQFTAMELVEGRSRRSRRSS